MAKPLDEQTDEELETALAQGLLDERKAATAKEILSRRWQSKSEKIRGSYGWADAMVACANKRPASLTATPSWMRVWRVRLEWGLGGASHIIAVRTLIALAVLDVTFAGPDFADGISQWLCLPFETAPPATHMDRLAEGTMRR